MQAFGIALESKHCTNDCNNAELHSLAKQLQKKAELIVGIPPAQVLFQKISADLTLSDDDLTLFLSSRLYQLFGTDANTLLWDYERHTQDNLQQITIVAARKSTVYGLRKLFQTYQVAIRAVEPTTFALARRLVETTGIYDCYALIPTEQSFLFITLHQGKIFHCEKLLRSQLNQLSLMVQFNRPFYFINCENHEEPPLSETFIALKKEIDTQEISLNFITLDANACLASWKST